MNFNKYTHRLQSFATLTLQSAFLPNFADSRSANSSSFFCEQRWYRPQRDGGESPLGAWVRDGYRQRDNAGYGDIFQTLVWTAVEISKGLNVDTFALEEIGEEGSPGRIKLMQHYANIFGAEIDGNPLYGNMVIKI